MLLLCLGDSITDCGRVFDSPPLGNGYVKQLASRLTLEGGDWKVINKGMDGLTLSKLFQNFTQSTLSMQPDLLTILIGINDVSLMKNTGRFPEQQKDMMDRFFGDYDSLLTALLPKIPHILLMEPLIFSYPAEYINWLPLVQHMSQGIEKLAKKYCLTYLFLQEPLNKAVHTYGAEKITTDGIHLTEKGNEVITDLLYAYIQSQL